jgi:hydrogenase-4 component B
MFQAAPVPQGAEGNLSFIPALFILLSVAGVVVRGMLTQAPASEGGLLRRYRLNTGLVLRSEFLLGLLFIALWLYAVVGRGSLVTTVPITGPGPGGNALQDITPLLLVLLPFLGALVTGLTGRKNGAIRDCVAICTAFLSFALALSMYPMVSAGPIVYELPSFIGLGLSFRVDFLGFAFAVLASFIWFLATFYSTEYMRHEHAPTRYYIFLLLSLGGCLGVFVAGDFLSLFLFFEAMTLASYVLVIHAESEEAMAAGRNYLYMGIFGGLCLLVAIMLLFVQTGTTAISPSLEALATMGNMRFLVALLFFLGFGIKAGAAPLHIWLPQAHPVAPTPASALLSGIMIKTGAFGIIRVFNLLFTPHDGHSPLWKMTGDFGFTLIWIGMVTMFTAAVLALSQRHAKRVLAYSSVSQMGYILMGIGAAAYLGYEGAMGFAGLSYHILNHAFFKAGMFLMVGAIYLRTHNLSYDRLGGLWRRFPVTALAFLVAGAAISGIPGFNGYVSKTLLHHAIVEAWEHHHVASLWYAEKIFTLTGGLTFCYILRLFTSIFLGKEREETNKYQGETYLERGIFMVFAGVILYGGLSYTQVIKKIILPMGNGFVYDSYGMNYVAKANVWNLHDLQGIGISLAIGATAYLLLSRIQFALPLPSKLSVEHLVYKPVLNMLIRLFMFVGRMIDLMAEGTQVGSIRPAAMVTRAARYLDTRMAPALGVRVLKSMTAARESAYNWVGGQVTEVKEYTRQAEWAAFFTMIKVDYNPRGDELYKKLTLMNLDLCLFIVVVTLVIIFSLRFLTLMVP